MRLITYEELDTLGCSFSNNLCNSAPSWVYATTYWTGSAYSSNYIWSVAGTSGQYGIHFTNNERGVRPVITISKSQF